MRASFTERANSASLCLSVRKCWLVSSLLMTFKCFSCARRVQFEGLTHTRARAVIMTSTRHPLPLLIFIVFSTPKTLMVILFYLPTGWTEALMTVLFMSEQLCLWLKRCCSGWLRAAWDPPLCTSVAGQGPASLGTRTSEDKHWPSALHVLLCFTVTWLEDWNQECPLLLLIPWLQRLMAAALILSVPTIPWWYVECYRKQQSLWEEAV